MRLKTSLISTALILCTVFNPGEFSKSGEKVTKDYKKLFESKSNDELLSLLNENIDKSHPALLAILIHRKCERVVPHLLKYLKDNPARGSIGTILGILSNRRKLVARLGPDALPLLADALKDENTDHEFILSTLLEFDSDLSVVLPNVYQIFQGGSAQTPAKQSRRRYETSVKLLAKLAWFQPKSIEKFKSKILKTAIQQFRKNENNYYIKKHLYSLLGSFKSQASELIPDIIQSFERAHQSEKVNLIILLQKISPSHPKLLSFTKELLSELSKKTINLYLLEPILSALGPSAKPILPDIFKVIRNTKNHLNLDGLSYSLTRVDEEAFFKFCLAECSNENRTAKQNAIYCLGVFKSKRNEVLKLLKKYIHDKDTQIAIAALQALEQLKEHGKDLIPEVFDLAISSKSQDLTEAVFWYLLRTRIPIPDFCNRLKSYIKDSAFGSEYTEGVVYFEMETDPKVKSCLNQFLLDILKSNDREQIKVAIYTLIRAGSFPEAKPFLEKIKKTLDPEKDEEYFELIEFAIEECEYDRSSEVLFEDISLDEPVDKIYRLLRSS